MYETFLRLTFEKVREISLKFSGMKYNENPSSSFRVVAFVHVRIDKRKDRAISIGILQGCKDPTNPISILSIRLL